MEDALRVEDLLSGEGTVADGGGYGGGLQGHPPTEGGELDRGETVIVFEELRGERLGKTVEGGGEER